MDILNGIWNMEYAYTMYDYLVHIKQDIEQEINRINEILDI